MTKQLSKETVLLYFLDEEHEEKIKGVTRFQKLVFLSQNGGFNEDPIEPLAHAETFAYEQNDYGPYSKELTACLDKLETEDKIEKITTTLPDGTTRTDYQITNHGKTLLNHRLGTQPDDPTELPQSLKVIKATKRLYNTRPILYIIDTLYAEYPDYTSPKIKDKI